MSTKLDGLPPQTISAVLQSLPREQNLFKISLCAQYLSRLAIDAPEGGGTQATVAQKKPKPRARRAVETSPTAPPPHFKPPLVVVPSTIDISHILLTPPHEEAESRRRRLIFKLHLLIAHGSQQQSKEVLEPEWQNFCDIRVRYPSVLSTVVGDAFPLSDDPGEKEIHNTALNFVSIWEKEIEMRIAELAN